MDFKSISYVDIVILGIQTFIIDGVPQHFLLINSVEDKAQRYWQLEEDALFDQIKVRLYVAAFDNVLCVVFRHLKLDFIYLVTWWNTSARKRCHLPCRYI